MAEPFIAEIRLFAGNFPPRYWAFCEGQLLPIAQNAALFSLLGTIYGGDGRTTFRLPDLRGRAPMHPGIGPGLSPRGLGEIGGSEGVTLTVNQIPAHTHGGWGEGTAATSAQPVDRLPASPAEDFYQAAGSKALTPMNTAAIGQTGSSQSHNNLQPYLALSFIIALFGVFPQRP